MKLVDCFMYFDEDLMLDLRLNILNQEVDKFVIVESAVDHSGNSKKLNFDLRNFKKFKDKIQYLVVDSLPFKQNFFSKSWRNEPSWLRENYQRNYLSEGFRNNHDTDLIMVSDIDEIPDPKKITNFDKTKKYACFVQKYFQQKLNLLNTTETNWYGTRICIKKYLKSPQWLRDIKIKRKFWKIYKPKPPQLIFNGGWHFSFLKSSKDISKKIKAYAHQEYNKEEFYDISFLNKKISDRQDILGRGHNYKKIEIDSTYPDYISNNKTLFKEWII